MVRASEAWRSTSYPNVVVFAAGRVPVLEGERYAGAVGRHLQRLRFGVDARLRITGPNCDVGPFLVQVNLRLGDTPTRIQTLTSGAGDALPVVVRLDRQLTALRAPSRPRPWPDPTGRLLDTPMPGGVARRKIVAVRTVSPLQAAGVMDAMDYDVHLFTDADTGEDAVVYRGGPSGLRLARQRGARPSLPDVEEPGVLAVDPHPAPEIAEAQAVQQVCDLGLPFLFYTDVGTRRGHLLYRRYDGELGLLARRSADGQTETQ